MNDHYKQYNHGVLVHSVSGAHTTVEELTEASDFEVDSESYEGVDDEGGGEGSEAETPEAPEDETPEAPADETPETPEDGEAPAAAE